MKLVFISNFFNHHQKFVSDVFYRECASYYFVSAEEMPEERKQLGYASLQAPYLIGAADLNSDILKNCDAVVIGSAPSQLIQSIKRDKLIFYYSERPLKQGNSPLKYLYRFFRWRKRDFGVRQLYMLCASAYAAADYAKFHLYKNCSYQWGYFPEAKVIVCSTVLPLLCVLFLPYGWWRFLLTGTLCVACTVPSVLYLGCSASERVYIYDAIGNFLRKKGLLKR